MDPILDLNVDFDPQAHAVKDLIESRKTLQRHLDENKETLSDEDFDALIARCQAVDEHINRSNRVTDRTQRLTTLTATPAPAVGSISRTTPQGLMRGPEANPGRDHYRKPDPQYSVVRAIGSILDQGRVTGYEGDVSQEIMQRFNLKPHQTGFYMPLSLPADVEMRRAGPVSTTSLSSTIPTTIDNSILDLLQNRLSLRKFGVGVMNDLVGNYQFPKQSADPGVFYVGESAAITESEPKVDQSVTLSPTEMGTFIRLGSRFFTMQSAASESWLRNRMESVLRLEVDRAGVDGEGTGGVPTGLLRNTDIPTVSTTGVSTTAGEFTYAKAVEMETAVAVANADTGSLGYITNAKVRGQLKTTLESSVAGATWVWQNSGTPGEGTINGYRAVCSNQMPADKTKNSGAITGLSTMLFGDYSQAMYGFWGGLLIIVNPFTDDTSGMVRITMRMQYDFKVLRPTSFVRCTDISTT